MSHSIHADKIFRDHLELVQAMLEPERQEAIVRCGEQLIEALESGNTLYIAGNGGSAADAQHFAAEITGRFLIKARRPLPAIALTTDSSALTAIANDFGYQAVFSRQVEALARPGDLFIGITTSGRSLNILEAMDKAAEMGVNCIGLVGNDGSAVAAYCKNPVTVPHNLTARVQEMHITVIHTWCDMIDRHFG